MSDDISGHLFEPVGAAHYRFFPCPFGKASLSIGQFIIFGDFFDALIHFLLICCRKFNLGQPALIIDAHGRAVFHGLLDVIDIDIIAKNRLSVAVLFFNRCAGETNKRSIGQGIAHVPGKAIDEIILAAVGFIRDYHYVAPFG
ncbi:hypothetical protein SDC9_66690 [bioreactor metagenome]|uniref:Uncharacterized protein n=1 Tax=bioreactor metagenome TaxID=1076179 RepID=A0A644XX67_9ZZZZ